jgi:hypothetical protein
VRQRQFGISQNKCTNGYRRNQHGWRSAWQKIDPIVVLRISATEPAGLNLVLAAIVLWEHRLSRARCPRTARTGPIGRRIPSGPPLAFGLKPCKVRNLMTRLFTPQMEACAYFPFRVRNPKKQCQSRTFLAGLGCDVAKLLTDAITRTGSTRLRQNFGRFRLPRISWSFGQDHKSPGSERQEVRAAIITIKDDAYNVQVRRNQIEPKI